MKYIGLLISSLFVAFALSGCADDGVDGYTGDGEAGGGNPRKILFSASGAEEGQLLVQFTEEAASRIASRATRSEVATRSGLPDVDAVMDAIDALSITPVFHLDPRFEADYRAAGLHLWYTMEFDPSVSLEHVARQLSELGDVAFVQYNHRVTRIDDGTCVVDNDQSQVALTRAASFNDPQLNRQWHYHNTGDEKLTKPIKAGADVNCVAAWDICAGDPSVIVAVVDEGVAYAHEDLAANMWVNEAERDGTAGKDDDNNGYVDDIYGYNFYANSGQIRTDKGHGTHVAGTVAAVNNNGVGVCGIAGGTGNNDGVRIMTLQIFQNGVCADVASVARAIEYAANNGAQILQCSWGSAAGSLTDDKWAQANALEKNAIDYFISKKRETGPIDGGIAIFATGNDAMPVGYPAAYSAVVAVTAFSSDFTPASYTNFGAPADITAPGGDAVYTNSFGEIYSTLPSGYGFSGGTSMACPHVSGVAALGLSYAVKLGKRFTKDEFRSMLLASVNEYDQYLVGTKSYMPYHNGTVQLSGFMDLEHDYKYKMGNGYVDAYKMLMNVRGTPAIYIKQGQEHTVDLSQYFGGNKSLMYVVNAESGAQTKLGMTFSVNSEKMTITCANEGAAILTVRTSIGGAVMSREVAVMSRKNVAANGGWL